LAWSGRRGAEEKAERLRRDADRHPDQDEEDDGEVGFEEH
jgi:hypothetical protein